VIADSIKKNSLVLALFALATSVLLASTYLVTKDTIAEAERHAAQRILLEIYPESSHDNDLLMDIVPIPEAYLSTLGLKKGADIYVAKMNGQTTGFIIPATAPDGYSGDIRLLVGVNRDGTVAGVRALGHNETPGLGDKIELQKSLWILDFNGKSLDNPERENWKVKKDKGYFDQFTGATITPRAVVDRVLKTLIFYREHRSELLKAAQKSTTGTRDE
jgi:H+/Na+-translocating ferredoxin:NAD+ oxidoreductase subunit G